MSILEITQTTKKRRVKKEIREFLKIVREELHQVVHVHLKVAEDEILKVIDEIYKEEQK